MIYIRHLADTFMQSDLQVRQHNQPLEDSDSEKAVVQVADQE